MTLLFSLITTNTIMRIELIATDGIVQKRLLWVEATSGGVYVGMVKIDGSKEHYSYHADGNTFSTANGKKQKLVQLQPFSSFKGMQQIQANVLGLGSFSTRVDYKQKKLTAAVYVDVRNYKSQMIECNLILLEPYRMDKLNFTPNEPLSELHVFSKFNPWIVFWLHDVPT
jgi:hypothetical protein